MQKRSCPNSTWRHSPLLSSRVFFDAFEKVMMKDKISSRTYSRWMCNPPANGTLGRKRCCAEQNFVGPFITASRAMCIPFVTWFTPKNLVRRGNGF